MQNSQSVENGTNKSELLSSADAVNLGTELNEQPSTSTHTALSTPKSNEEINNDDGGGGDEKRDTSLLEQEEQYGWKRYLGVIYVFCAVSMSSLASNILKLLSHVDPVTVGLYSSAVGVLCSTPFILVSALFVKNKSVMDHVLPLGKHKKVIFFMWLRSTSTVLLTFSFIWSIRTIMVSDARTIFASSVIIVNIFGSICFKEKFRIVTAIMSVIALGGIFVMSKPPILTGKAHFNDGTLVGIAFALFCMLCSALNMLILRFLHNVHQGVQNAFLFTCAFFSILPFAIGFEKMEIPQCTTKDILLTILYGVLASFTNTFLALGLQIEKVGVVALVRTTDLIFTFMWQMILLKAYPDWISYLGAGLVLIGVLVVGIQKWLEGKDEDSVIRKRFKWLLL